MKKPFLNKILCSLISICLLLPVILLVTNYAASDDEESNNYLYIYREGESWDYSYEKSSGLNWEKIKNNGTISQDASDGAFTDVKSVEGAGDYAEWDFNVHQAGTYKIWVRGYHSIFYNICESIILEWNESQINEDPQDWHKIGGWTWSCFGSVTCAADTLATIRIKSLDEGWVPVDKLLITDNTSYTPSGIEEDVGSITHDIGDRPPSWGDGIFDLDYDFIYNKTENLSNIIFQEIWPTDLEKGRAFGTEGEIYAGDKLKDWFKDEIGIHTAKERVIAYPGEGIDDKMEINALGLTINNGNEQEIDEVFIGVNSSRNKFIKLDATDTGNYTCTNLVVRNWYDAHHFQGTFAEDFDADFSEFLDSNATDIINETMNIVNTTNATFQGTLFNVTLKYFEEYHGISFSNPDENNIENWTAALSGYSMSTGEPYVWIIEDPWNNPDPIDFPIMDFFYNLLSEGKKYFIEKYFFEFPILTYCIRVINGFALDKCKGIILYDFNNNTHNMINTQTLGFLSEETYNPDNIYPVMGLPLIFINGSIGQEINESYEDYTVSFYRDQSFNDSVESYNVIGTIYGIEQNKTVILSSLYDSWWNQGTTDSAIGISIVLGIAKYYKENNIIPRYNLKFVCFSGEEYGLLGAQSYEARHKDEEIVAVIDLNQLGFEERYDIPLNFTMYVNNEEVNDSIGPVVQRSNYENRTFHHANFTTLVSENGGPSNDAAFAIKRNESGIQTVCFLKDTGWTLHHRDGKNELTNEPHSDGDMMSYYNKTYVKVVSEMILNVTKYFAGESIYLYNGWNLITIPLNTSWMASTLAENITGCQMISWFDPVNQTYKTHIVGVPSYDFVIKDGYGLFIYVNQNSIIGICGDIITSVSIPLRVGWNMIGWYHDFNTTASNLANCITGCEMVSWFDAGNQTFKTHIVGVPSYDFPIVKGMGIFVCTNESSTWYGDDNCERGESKGGKESEGGSPGLPYPIYGQAYYKNQSVPALNANITIINLNTSGWFNGTIPSNLSGWFNDDFDQLNNTNYTTGNILRIYINGTGDYKGWNGQKDIIMNTSVPGENISVIYCVYPSYPEISNISLSSTIIGIGENVAISANITDEVNEITQVKINVTFPDESWINTSMTNMGNNQYTYTFNDTWIEGTYEFYIWAKNDINYTNMSSMDSFNVDASASISICTLYNSYTEDTFLNLTDPPGGLTPKLGYEFLDDNQVLHIWNRYDSYYFNISSGIQLTNHKDEYWSRNVLMLGYYNNDEWNLIYRTDELTGFQKYLDSDNQTYINITLWKNLEYHGYKFRLTLRYHLGLDDNELTIIPYIKNLGIPIPYILGFAWEINDIQIDNTAEDDYLLINDSYYWLNENLNLTFSNLSRPVYCWNETVNDNVVCGYEPIPYFYIRENLSEDTMKSLYLRWNPNVNYHVWVKTRNNSFNAPVVLGIRIGTLNAGESKQTQLFWYDASQVIYYFNKYSLSEAWTTNPGYMVDNQTRNYASTTISEVERCTSNSCPKYTDLGSISKVELRALGFRTGGSWSLYLRPVFDNDDGDNHQFALPTTPEWSSWFDITSDSNAPEEWVWSDVIGLDCDVDLALFHGLPAPTAYCSKVELQVTYIPWTPPCITNPSPSYGSMNVSISPLVGITVSDINNESLDISWLSNSSGEWQEFGTNLSVGNGTYYQTLEGADVNGQWWYWMVNVSDSHDYNVSNVFKFYTGLQSKISNTGETDIKGLLLMQVDYWNGSDWVKDLVVINDSSPRIINKSSELGLDTVFNGLLSTGDLGFGDGTYRVYACFCDPDGEVLVVDETMLEAWWSFELDMV